MTTERPRMPYAYVLSELARNPKIILTEAVVLSRKRAVEVRESIDAIIRGSPTPQGLFVVVDDGYVADDGAFYRTDKEAPPIYTSLEEAAEEASRVHDYLKTYYTGKGHKPTTSVMRLCELIEKPKQCKIKRKKIIRPKVEFFPQDILTNEKVQTDGQFAAVIYSYYGDNDGSHVANEDNAYGYYFCVVGKDFDSAVKQITPYEEYFIPNHGRSQRIGSSLVYFGKIVADVGC